MEQQAGIYIYQSDFLFSILQKHETGNNYNKVTALACRNDYQIKWLCSGQMCLGRKFIRWHRSCWERVVVGPFAEPLHHFEVWRQWVIEFALRRGARFAEWPIWSVARLQKEALSMCAVGQWIILMDARLLSPLVHPPSAAVFQARQAGRGTNCTKSRDGKNWSHLQIVLTLSGKKDAGWPVGPLTVGQFVKQRDFGRAQPAVDEEGKPISTICKSIPESSSIISASSLFLHLASFSKMKIETYKGREQAYLIFVMDATDIVFENKLFRCKLSRLNAKICIFCYFWCTFKDIFVCLS